MTSEIHQATRNELYALVGQLPESEVYAAKRYLQFLLGENGELTPEGHKRGSTAALKAFLEGPPALTPEEGKELTQFLKEESERSLTDYHNP